MARSFNASTQYLSNSSTSPITGFPITLACWFNCGNVTSGSDQYLIALGNSANFNNSIAMLLKNGSGGKLACFTTNSTGSFSSVAVSATVPNSHQWYQAVATIDGSLNANVYLAGAIGTGATVLNISATPSLTTIGSYIDGPPNSPYQGFLAECGIWNVVLTQTEISALASGCRCYQIRSTALVGYWPLDGLQSPEPDLSGEANNMSLTGSPPLGFPGPPYMQFTPRWPIATPIPPAISSFALPPIGFGGSPNMVRRTNVIMA